MLHDVAFDGQFVQGDFERLKHADQFGVGRLYLPVVDQVQALRTALVADEIQDSRLDRRLQSGLD